MFCAGTDGAQSTNLLLGIMGNRLYWGLESTEGQFDQQQQTNVEQGPPQAVRLLISDTHVELFLNGVLKA